MIRLAIADDQELVRAGLRLILEAEGDLEIVAEASDGEEAVLLAGRHRPDLVLMDVRMPGIDGIEATRRLAGHPTSPPVLVLTTFEDDEVLWGSIQAGAAGFVLKDVPADDLVAAVRATAAGGSWLDPRVTPRLLGRLRQAPPARAPDAVEQLSGRELEVLRLMAAGRNNPEIAAALHLSERTVKSHVGSIFTKLGARDRAAAIIVAYRSGLADPFTG